MGARTHTRRGETECSSRSEAETCAGGLSWHNRPAEGKLIEVFGANGAKRNEAEGLAELFLKLPARDQFVGIEVTIRAGLRSVSSITEFDCTS